MDEYKRDIEEIKELLKKIQKEIAELSAEPYTFTIPEPVQSVAACYPQSAEILTKTNLR